MNEKRFERGDLVVAMSAMNRAGFDFVGRYAGIEDGCLALENPLVLEYDEKRVLQRLAPLHLPFGTVDTVGQRNVLGLPLEGIAYFVAVPAQGRDWMHQEYEAVFSAMPAES